MDARPHKSPARRKTLPSDLKREFPSETPLDPSGRSANRHERPDSSDMDGDARSASEGSAVPASVMAAQDRFISLWGEMGSAWGIPRTMAEVHALLYIGGDALNTDDVMGRLRISRGNASMTLRTLVDWGLVSRVHNRGDRREYFRAEQDVWKLFATILRERKRREFDPLLEALTQCRSERPETVGESRRRRRVDPESRAAEEHDVRLDEMLELVRTLDRLSERFIGSGGPGLLKAARLIMKVS